VIHQGRLSPLRPTRDWTRETIGLEMLGTAEGTDAHAA